MLLGAVALIIVKLYVFFGFFFEVYYPVSLNILIVVVITHCVCLNACMYYFIHRMLYIIIFCHT